MISGARLGLDIRATQNPKYAERGIGRYVTQLAAALERISPGAVDAFLVDRQPGAPDLAPGARQLPRLVPSNAIDQAGWRDAPTVFHAMSPFEDAPLDEVWPRSLRRRNAALVVTAYDLIPLVFPDRYLADPFTRRHYLNRCNLLLAADLVLAISEATGADLVERLGVPEARVVVVGGGVDPWFSPGGGNRATALARVRQAIPGIGPQFIMYTGGIDYRKNVEGAIDAYGLLSPDLRANHQLVITCSVTKEERASLETRARTRGVAGRVVVTGYVTDEVLRDLYRACRLFVFPSIYEGFGLPIAEARACGAPVIAGDNSSLRELVRDPRARFEASSPPAVAACIEDVLRDQGFEQRLRDDALRQDLSWDRVATRTISAYEQAGSLVRRRRAVRPRLALITPWPPQLSGVADYAHMLVPHLTANFDVDVVVDGDPAGLVPPPPPRARLMPLAGFDITSAWRRYDRVIYQVGNSEFHARALDMLARVPGEVILHDVRLTGLYWWRGHHTSAPLIGDELARMYGSSLPAELAGAAHVDGDVAERLGVWMLHDILEGATRIWVHSAFAREVVEAEASRAGRTCMVEVLPFGFPGPGSTYAAAAAEGAAQLPPSASGAIPGADAEVTRVTAFGVLGPSKANEVLVDAVPRIVAACPDAHLIFVGPVEDDWRAALSARARALGVEDRVGFTGALPAAEYETWMRDADVAVQLRRTTNGESSATVADALANGVPAVVTQIGWLAELPPGAVEWVARGADAAEVAAAVSRVLGDASRRHAMVEVGTEYALSHGFARTAAVLQGAGAAAPAR